MPGKTGLKWWQRRVVDVIREDVTVGELWKLAIAIMLIGFVFGIAMMVAGWRR